MIPPIRSLYTYPDRPERHRFKLALIPLLLLALAFLPQLVRAEEGDEPERYVPTTRSEARSTIAERADANGVSSWALDRLASCETGGTYDPASVGDHGTSLGLFQLNTLPTGLYWHFLEVGYSDAFDAYQAADYVARVAAGEWARQGVHLGRWSCWRMLNRGGR